MFTKSFFKFLAGFLSIVALGILGATLSSQYIDSNNMMGAGTAEGR